MIEIDPDFGEYFECNRKENNAVRTQYLMLILIISVASTDNKIYIILAVACFRYFSFSWRD